MDIKIIGAGLGGLATSCMLAHRGHNVTILEKNSTPGGKINQVIADGFRFDTGPSLLTMPFILERLFEYCGEELSDHLDITPVDPICRYFYPSGVQFDCYQDSGLNIAQIQEFAPDDIQAYKDFLTYAEQLYEHTKEAFLFNPLYGLSDLGSLNFIDFFKIDPFQTVAERINKQFKSNELRKFFKRFTTYNGSSPFRAPATLNVIPHVELSLGGYYLDGGMYSLVNALVTLAENKGVAVEYNTEIKQINTSQKKISGVTDVDGNFWPADLVVSNSDASETYLKLIEPHDISTLKRKRIASVEPSCSGFVAMLGINRTYDSLSHHNIFFSQDYHREFKHIFEDKIMPEDPTIYVANTSYSNPEHAPKGGSNLFILVNAPYLSDDIDWNEESPRYKEKVIKTLEAKGLSDLSNHIQYSNTITPKDFYHQYRSNKGSIYGTSSNNKLAAFLRPKNKSRSIKGLYLVGGSTHPGGGIPLVTLSAFHAVELIDRFEG